MHHIIEIGCVKIGCKLYGKTFPESVWQRGTHAPATQSDWLAAINDHLDKRIEDMKTDFRACETASQKNALGTAIITVNAIAGALQNARKQMAANTKGQR